MSDDQYDQFGDIVQKESGIFGLDTAAMSNALHKHETCQTSAIEDGVHVTLQCPVCGSTREITFEWAEMSCLSKNVSPSAVIPGMTPWAFTRQGWRPVGVKCSGCISQDDLMVFVTQPEAAKHTQQGESQGFNHFRRRPPIRDNPHGLSAHRAIVDYIQKGMQQPR